MKTDREGFTFAEVLLVVAVVGLVLIAGFAVVVDPGDKAKPVSWRTPVTAEGVVVDPLVEECVNGYVFIRNKTMVVQKMSISGPPAICS